MGQRPILLATVLSAALLAAPGARAEHCVPDAASDVRVVGRGERASPLSIPAGRLCADLHGERRDAGGVSINIGIGNGPYGDGGQAGGAYGAGNAYGSGPAAGAPPGPGYAVGPGRAPPLYDGGGRRAPTGPGPRIR